MVNISDTLCPQSSGLYALALLQVYDLSTDLAITIADSTREDVTRIAKQLINHCEKHFSIKGVIDEYKCIEHEHMSLLEATKIRNVSKHCIWKSITLGRTYINNLRTLLLFDVLTEEEKIRIIELFNQLDEEIPTEEEKKEKKQALEYMLGV